MAAITFSYRSKKNRAALEIRLSFRIEGQNLHPETKKEMPFSYYTRSQVEVSKDFWEAYKKNTNFKDAEKINLKAEVDSDLSKLRRFILEQFEKSEPSKVDKEWLENAVKEFYSPSIIIKQAPEDLVCYYDYYLELRKHELKEKIRSWQKWITVKHKLERLQKANGRKYKVQDVNEDFVRDWANFCKSENYSNQTTQKEFSYIKTICTHAKTKRIEVSPELDSLKVKLKQAPTHKIYLSFTELERIEAVEDLPPYLENAKDWLLISCYTGQRVSDFMRFNKSMLRTSKRKTFIDIKQVKTGKEVTVPILPIVMEILKKRNGDFPKPISYQRYNDYVKEVASRAGLTRMTEGGIRLNNRKVVDKYPKWQLVSSHIGRRSFATNYYGKIPTTFLKDITGHGTEQMLLAYIGKTSKDTAFEAYDLLMKATA